MKVEQLSMADQLKTMSRTNDPKTSKDAAKKAVLRASSDAAKILEIFKEIYPEGLIDEELIPLAEAKGVRADNATKRRSDLSNKFERLEYTGENRLTTRKCEAKVWRYKNV